MSTIITSTNGSIKVEVVKVSKVVSDDRLAALKKRMERGNLDKRGN